MFRDSKEYKVLTQIREAMELYEDSYSILNKSKELIDTYYPSNTKKTDYLKEYRRVKNTVDYIRSRVSSIPLGTSAFNTVSEAILENIRETDTYIKHFVEKYKLNEDSGEIGVKESKKMFRPTEESLCALVGESLFGKKKDTTPNAIQDNLRILVDSDKLQQMNLNNKVDDCREANKWEDKKLIQHYKDKIESLRKHNIDTSDYEDKLKKLENNLPKPEVKLTKNQIKKIVSPFRHKMSTCHKSYNFVKSNLKVEDVISIYQETMDIVDDFDGVYPHLNEVDLNELVSLLKRIDRLAIDFPGVLCYDFDEIKHRIEVCKNNLRSSGN